MTPRFSNFCENFVLKWECDYPRDQSGQMSNDPSDPGGLTKWGIDKRAHPGVDIANLTLEGALAIYWQEWVGLQCDDDPPGMGEAFFDAAVNCGRSRAVQFLNSAHTVSEQITARESFYRRLASSRPSLKKFLSGWLNRTTDLRKYLDL